MADFSQSQLSQRGFNVPRTSTVQPVNTQGGSGTEAALQFVGQLTNMFVENQQKKALSADQSFIGNMESRLLSLADAVDQGALTVGEARTRSRAEVAKNIGARPDLRESIGASFRNTLSGTQLGTADTQATVEREARSQEFTKAIQEGWVKPNMTQPERTAALDDFRSRNKAVSDLEFEIKKTNETKGRVDLSSAQLSLLEKDSEIKSKDSLMIMSTSLYGKTESDAAEIVKGFESTGDKKGALNALNGLNAQVDNIASPLIRRFLTEDEVDNLVFAHRQAIASAASFVNGDIDRDVMNSNIADTKAQATLEALRDPTNQKLFGFRSIVGDSSMSRFVSNVAFTKYMEGVIDGTSTIQNTLAPENKEANKASNDLMIKTAQSYPQAGGTSKQSAIDTLNTYTNSKLKSFNLLAGSTARPADVLPEIQYLANDSIGNAIVAGDIVLDPDAVIGYQAMLGIAIADKVRPLVRELRLLPIQKNEADVDDVFDVITTGGRVRFVPNEAKIEALIMDIPEAAGSANISELRRVNILNKVREAQEGLAKSANLINTTVRSMAHVSGHKNYDQIIKQFLPTIVE